MASIAGWIKENVAVYAANAAAVRDYRSQLRGNKPIFLWTAYVGLLVLVTALAYAGIVDNQMMDRSAASIQSSLSGFYQTVVALVGGLIFLVTPSLTATTVVMERQRKSLDLVFSAPVSAKYYLVGKMLSSMRYTWMLLILSLPFTAVGVVMGGATWGDVLAAYAMLAGASLVLTAFGLLMSVEAPTVASAAVWTYMSIGAYLILTSMISAASAVSAAFGRHDLEGSWAAGLNPFLVSYAAPTHTTIWGVQVPNWILVLIYSVLMAKLLVLGAASALSGYGSAETKSLRIHLIALMGILGWLTAVTVVWGGPMGAGPTQELLAREAGFIVVAVSFGMPIIACFGRDGDRRNRYDGLLSIRRMLLGTPSGALPFLLALGVVLFAVAWIALSSNGSIGPDSLLPAAGFWAVTYLCFWWGCTRLVSALAGQLKRARILTVLMGVVVLALPIPVITTLYAQSGYSSPEEDYFLHLHILYPLICQNPSRAAFFAYGIGMLCCAAICAAVAEFAVRNAARIRREA